MCWHATIELAASNNLFIHKDLMTFDLHIAIYTIHRTIHCKYYIYRSRRDANCCYRVIFTILHTSYATLQSFVMLYNSLRNHRLSNSSMDFPWRNHGFSLWFAKTTDLIILDVMKSGFQIEKSSTETDLGMNSIDFLGLGKLWCEFKSL